MHEQTVVIDAPSGSLGVHVVRPEGDGPFPVVVFLHHGPGLDDASKRTMARIAGWGYVVVAHDRYHRVAEWYVMPHREDAESRRMYERLTTTTEDLVADDVGAVLEWLAGEPAAGHGPMGCIGYCIGARSALHAMRDRGDRFRAIALLHPAECTTDEPDSPHLAVSSYTGSLYVGFGAEDRMQPAGANGPLIDAANALATGLAEVHDGADHGFAIDGDHYHAAAAGRSYERIEEMFERELLG